MIRFTQPLALLLLLALPLAAWLGWPARGAARRRETASLVLRCLVLAALILGLAGFEITQSAAAAPRAVVFVVDVSASISSAGRAAQDDYIRTALDAMGHDDRAAIVVFGEEALVERPMSYSRVFEPLTSTPGRSGSSLAKAIVLAITLYPPNTARRMVLLTDGQQTSGDARQAVRLASDLGVEVVAADLEALLRQSGAEVILKNLSLPANLRQGDQFELNLTLESSERLTNTLPVTLLSNGSVAYNGELALENEAQTAGGWQYTAVISQTARQTGFVQYQAQLGLGANGDQVFQNNAMAAFTQVAGTPQVLLVAPPAGEELPGGEARPDESTLLQLALTGAGNPAGAAFDLQKTTPVRMPGEVERLAQYAAVILVDVPARQFTDGQIQGLQNYVSLGGGLLTVGGPTSFGVGGYNNTPLEDVLPVEMEIKDEKRRPSLGIVFIIDHSGSMADLSGGKTKLEIAKEAVIRSLEMLEPQDRVGVVAFDDTAVWVAEIGPLENKGRLVSLVGTLEPGGGTDILAGVQAMARVLPADPAVNKHVILLTDGGADPSGIAQLVGRLYKDYGITLSTIGVGRDAAPFLPDLAKAGGGRYHFAANPSQIPRIFSEETALATRAYIVEGAFQPELANPTLADTLGVRSTPPLLGYVATSAKPASQVVLQAPPPNQDPILAVWNYGLGKAAAFTSDATSRWAVQWVFNPANSGALRPEFVQFWQGLVRYVMGTAAGSPLSIRVETGQADRAAGARLEVDTASTGHFLNGYTVQAVVVDPQGASQAVSLAQTAPGLYSGSFTPGAEGVYMISVSGTSGLQPGAEADTFGETTGWVLSYSPEFARLKTKADRQRILLLLAAGGLSGEPFAAPEQVFNYVRAAGGRAAAQPIWPWLLGLAALLLPADIAIRRLVVSAADLRAGLGKAWGRLSSAIKPRLNRQGLEADGPRARQMQTLLKAKDGGTARRETLPQPPPEPADRSDAGQMAGIPPESPGEKPVSIPAPRPELGPDSPPAQKPATQGETSSISALLKSKRGRSGSDKR